MGAYPLTSTYPLELDGAALSEEQRRVVIEDTRTHGLWSPGKESCPVDEVLAPDLEDAWFADVFVGNGGDALVFRDPGPAAGTVTWWETNGRGVPDRGVMPDPTEGEAGVQLRRNEAAWPGAAHVRAHGVRGLSFPHADPPR